MTPTTTNLRYQRHNVTVAELQRILRSAAADGKLSEEETTKLVAVAKPGYLFFPGSYVHETLQGDACCPVSCITGYRPADDDDPLHPHPADDEWDKTWGRVASSIDSQLPGGMIYVEVIR